MKLADLYNISIKLRIDDIDMNKRGVNEPRKWKKLELIQAISRQIMGGY